MTPHTLPNSVFNPKLWAQCSYPQPKTEADKQAAIFTPKLKPEVFLMVTAVFAAPIQQ